MTSKKTIKITGNDILAPKKTRIATGEEITSINTDIYNLQDNVSSLRGAVAGINSTLVVLQGVTLVAMQTQISTLKTNVGALDLTVADHTLLIRTATQTANTANNTANAAQQDVRTLTDELHRNYLLKTGDSMTGNLTFTLGDIIFNHPLSNIQTLGDELVIRAGRVGTSYGSKLVLNSSTSQAGPSFMLQCANLGGQLVNLTGDINGELTWNGHRVPTNNEVLMLDGSTLMQSNIGFDNGDKGIVNFSDDETSKLTLCGAYNSVNNTFSGGTLTLTGIKSGVNQGGFVLTAYDITNPANSQSFVGEYGLGLTWNGENVAVGEYIPETGGLLRGDITVTRSNAEQAPQIRCIFVDQVNVPSLTIVGGLGHDNNNAFITIDTHYLNQDPTIRFRNGHQDFIIFDTDGKLKRVHHESQGRTDEFMLTCGATMTGPLVIPDTAGNGILSPDSKLSMQFCGTDQALDLKKSIVFVNNWGTIVNRLQYSAEGELYTRNGQRVHRFMHANGDTMTGSLLMTDDAGTTNLIGTTKKNHLELTTGDTSGTESSVYLYGSEHSTTAMRGDVDVNVKGGDKFKFHTDGSLYYLPQGVWGNRVKFMKTGDRIPNFLDFDDGKGIRAYDGHSKIVLNSRNGAGGGDFCIYNAYGREAILIEGVNSPTHAGQEHMILSTDNFETIIRDPNNPEQNKKFTLDYTNGPMWNGKGIALGDFLQKAGDVMTGAILFSLPEGSSVNANGIYADQNKIELITVRGGRNEDSARVNVYTTKSPKKSGFVELFNSSSNYIQFNTDNNLYYVSSDGLTRKRFMFSTGDIITGDTILSDSYKFKSSDDTCAIKLNSAGVSGRETYVELINKNQFAFQFRPDNYAYIESNGGISQRLMFSTGDTVTGNLIFNSGVKLISPDGNASISFKNQGNNALASVNVTGDLLTNRIKSDSDIHTYNLYLNYYGVMPSASILGPNTKVYMTFYDKEGIEEPFNESLIIYNKGGGTGAHLFEFRKDGNIYCCNSSHNNDKKVMYSTGDTMTGALLFSKPSSATATGNGVYLDETKLKYLSIRSAQSGSNVAHINLYSPLHEERGGMIELINSNRNYVQFNTDNNLYYIQRDTSKKYQFMLWDSTIAPPTQAEMVIVNAEGKCSHQPIQTVVAENIDYDKLAELVAAKLRGSI